MAETLQLLIEAEDRTKRAFDSATKGVTDLQKQYADATAKIAAAQTIQANGQVKVNIAASAYLAIVKQQDDATQKLVGAKKLLAQELHKLEAAHLRVARAQQQMAAQQQRSMDAAGASLMNYIKGFAGIAGTVEILRRSVTAHADFERQLTRIRMEGGATGDSLTHLQHKFHELAKSSGEDAEKLMHSFRGFRDAIGGSGGGGMEDTFEVFEKVTKAAKVADVSFESLSKSVVNAIKTMNVPMHEVEGVLDVWTNKIPASMMETWNASSNTILGKLRSLGFTGEAAAKKVGAAFGDVSTALGDAGKATTLIDGLLRHSTDTSNHFGMSMVGHVQKMKETGLDQEKLVAKAFDTLKSYGVYSENITQQDQARRGIAKGISEETIQYVKDQHEWNIKTREEADKLGVSVESVRERYRLLEKDGKGGMDKLIQASKELYTEIGKALGGDIVTQFAAKIESLSATIRGVQETFRQFRVSIGTEEEAQGPVRPGEPPPGVRRPLSPRVQNVVTSPWMNAIPLFGPLVRGANLGANAIEGYLNQPSTVPPDRNAVPTLQERQDAADARTRENFRLYGAPGPRRVQPGRAFATGGEFEVGGKEGIDREPVGFMATRGERVAVTTEKDQSLQAQQDKADIAMREHFARFHSSAFTKTVAAPWWPSGGPRAPGSGASPLSGGGGTASPGGGGSGDGGGSGPDNKSGNDPPNTGPRADPRTSYDPRYPGNAPAGQTPSLTGPFGQVMPAWGAVTTDPGGVYWGGGTGTGAAGNVPGLAGGPSGRALTKEERAAQAPPAGGGGGDGGGTPTGGGSAYLAKQRAAMFAELDKDPATKAVLLRLMKAENHSQAPGARAAVLERLVNAAMLSKKSIKHHIYNGYYGPINKGGPAAISDADAAVSQRELDLVRGGSNLIDLRTKQGMWNEKHREHPWTKQVGVEKSRLKNVLGEFYSDADQQTQDRMAKHREAMIAHDKGVAGAGPQSTALGPDALPPPGTVPPGSRTTAGIEPEPGQPRTTTDGAPAGTATSGGDKAVINETAAGKLKGVDPVLVQAVREGSKFLPEGYTIRPTSGLRKGDPGYHGKGVATDWQIYTPDGKALPNQGHGEKETKLHQDVARGAYGWLLKNHPEKAKRFEWGGAFNTRKDGSGVPDLMHYDFGGKRGRYANRSLAKLGPLYQGQGTPPTTTVKPADPKPPDNKPAAAPTNVAQGKAGSPSGPSTKTAAKPPDNKPATAPANTAAAPDTKVAAVTPDAPDPRNKAPSEGKQWGGSVRGGRRYTVGESGPETFTPAGPGEITPGGMNLSGMMGQYQQFADMLRQPIIPNLQMPRAGPMRQRMSRHVEAQRERDVGRMTRHASHSDIGFA